MILETNGISKAFGELKATDGVSFGLESNILCALIGPNGAGKSTLFNLITGLLKVDGGTVMFGGVDITNKKSYKICNMGLSRTFQIVSIFPKLNLFDSVQAAVLSHKKKQMNVFSRRGGMFRDEVLGLLDIVGLVDKADKVSANLAHGDKKRLEMAIALASEPKMLLLDEPTSGMAAEETGEIMSLVKKLRDDLGISIFFVEHDMSAVFGWAERIIVLHQGRIIADGVPAEVKDNRQVQEIYLGGEV